MLRPLQCGTDQFDGQMSSRSYEVIVATSKTNGEIVYAGDMYTYAQYHVNLAP